MQKRLVNRIREPLPEALGKVVSEAEIYDSSCSPEARVYFIKKGRGLYLKISAEGSLRNEAVMDRYFFGKGLSAEVLFYGSEGGRDYLLTAAVAGEDCTHEDYLSQPEKLCRVIASELRRLHDLDASDCTAERMSSYFAAVEEGRRIGRCDLSYYSDLFGDITEEEAYRLALSGKEKLSSRVLLHGDYCLPNIMLDDFSLSGFIDLGNGGIGDRHLDIFWGIWTLNFNLHTTEYTNLFLDTYGRELIDLEKLKIIAAAECFG